MHADNSRNSSNMCRQLFVPMRMALTMYDSLRCMAIMCLGPGCFLLRCFFNGVVLRITKWKVCFFDGNKHKLTDHRVAAVVACVTLTCMLSSNVNIE
jgi:hypothetical protein